MIIIIIIIIISYEAVPLSLDNFSSPVTSIPPLHPPTPCLHLWTDCNWWMGKRSIKRVFLGLCTPLPLLHGNMKYRKIQDAFHYAFHTVHIRRLWLDLRHFHQGPLSFWKEGRNWPNWVQPVLLISYTSWEMVIVQWWRRCWWSSAVVSLLLPVVFLVVSSEGALVAVPPYDYPAAATFWTHTGPR